MSEPTHAAHLKTPGGFANLLASITRRLEEGAWDESALADDVSTITYEQALRAARPVRAAKLATRALLEDNPPVLPVWRASKSEQLIRTGEKKPRTASITIRVTAEEQIRLQERALAAGLSVSAYLRSCIFETEALRSQVKIALEQMQTASSQTTSILSDKKASPKWRMRLFPGWSRSRTSDG